MKILIIIIIISFLICGCCGTIVNVAWKDNPEIRKIENEYLEANITPILKKNTKGCYESFNLSIYNKSDKNIELNWNKTLYYANGQTSGGFMFEGIFYRDKNEAKLPDIILPKSQLSKIISPSILAVFYEKYGWYRKCMNAGEHGVLLTFAVDSKEINEKMTVMLSGKEKRPAKKKIYR